MVRTSHLLGTAALFSTGGLSDSRLPASSPCPGGVSGQPCMHCPECPHTCLPRTAGQPALLLPPRAPPPRQPCIASARRRPCTKRCQSAPRRSHRGRRLSRAARRGGERALACAQVTSNGITLPSVGVDPTTGAYTVTSYAPDQPGVSVVTATFLPAPGSPFQASPTAQAGLQLSFE